MRGLTIISVGLIREGRVGRGGARDTPREAVSRVTSP